MKKEEEVSIFVFVEFSYIKNSEKCYKISVPIQKDNNNKSLINLKNIVIKLSKNINKINNYSICYYSNLLNSYLYLGKFNMENNNFYTFNNKINNDFIIEYDSTQYLKLKFREILKKENLIHTNLIDEEENLENNNNIIKENYNNLNIKSKRAKERKIGEIIKKVYLWRKLNLGFYDKKLNKEIKYSLEDGAMKLGISKKSLDDYLIQLRLGKFYGFNFNEHINDKVGVLRAFVKKNRAIENLNFNN